MTDTDQDGWRRQGRIRAAKALALLPLMFMLHVKWFTNILRDRQNVQTYNLFLHAAATRDHNHKSRF